MFGNFFNKFIPCGRIKSLGRSDRPENEDNAPFLFDDVYKNGTRGEKKQANARQYGRSMIEMLGVLAIIGVLSVGGIAGYSRAMYKYRMNQTIQTITQAMQRLIELSGQDWGKDENGYDLEIYKREEAVKYGLLPAAMCPDDYTNIRGETGISCKLPVGEIRMDIEQSVLNKMPHGEFEISFFEGDIVQSCVDFLSYHWEKLYPQEWLINNDKDYNNGSFISVDSETHSQTLWAVQSDLFGTKADITLSDIQKVCAPCKGQSYCQIYMVFNGEL